VEAARRLLPHPLDDRQPPRRELLDHAARDALQLRPTLPRLLPVDTERPRELGPQMCLIEVASRKAVGLEDRLAVERAPLRVTRALRHIRHDHVRVQVRVLRAARAVLVSRRHEAAAVLADEAVLAAPGNTSLVLEVLQRRLPRRRMRLVHGPPRALIAEGVEEADTLRRAEDEVEAGDGRELLLLNPPLVSMRIDPFDRDRALLRVFTQPLLGQRVDAADERSKLPVLHDPFESEDGGSAACPDARRLAAAGVVLVEPGRHRSLVVRLLPRRELCDRKHTASLASVRHFCIRMHLRLACYRA